MKTEICSCQGMNSNCKKCYGSGFINSNVAPSIEKTKTNKNKKEFYIPKNIEGLSQNEVEDLAIQIIGSLDLKSKKQMQILNSIPFNTNTFRRDFGAKFEQLEKIEIEKQHLRNELLRIDQIIIANNYKSNFRFKHYLSDKDVDVTSNRQLKGLIKEYKRLKNI